MPFRSVSAHQPARPVSPDDASSTSEADARVHQLSAQDVDTLATIQRSLTANKNTTPEDDHEPHYSFRTHLEEVNRALEEKGQPIGRLGVCFKDVTTYGAGGGNAIVKTYADAVWRTLTFQDVYEWTLKKWINPEKIEAGRPLIHNFSGVLRPGEMML